jgi:hypothetical protein
MIYLLVEIDYEVKCLLIDFVEQLHERSVDKSPNLLIELSSGGD